MNVNQGIRGLGLLACLVVTASASPAKATLKLGDPAPPVLVLRWLKGEPINLNRGRVNVVEFWATWCGPCKASMPHLSEVAARFKDQVDVTGISIFENGTDPLPEVERFVAHAGNSMAYNVGFGGGKDCAMGKTWFEAAGADGIPLAFVVDRQGRIAWIGHPTHGLEDAVALAVQDKLDPAAAAKVDRDFEARVGAIKDLPRRIEREARAGNLEAFGDLVHQLTSVDAFNADESVPTAYATLAQAHPDLAAAYAPRILKDYGNAPEVLTAVAKEICGETGRVRKDRDVPFAVKLLAQADTCQEGDMEFRALYARALFMNKDFEKAVDQQRKAMVLLDAFRAETEAMGRSKTPKDRERFAFIRKGVKMLTAKFTKDLRRYQAALAQGSAARS
jgi:thiol-disulfide isomerase/thioredoxin